MSDDANSPLKIAQTLIAGGRLCPHHVNQAMATAPAGSKCAMCITTAIKNALAAIAVERDEAKLSSDKSQTDSATMRDAIKDLLAHLSNRYNWRSDLPKDAFSDFEREFLQLVRKLDDAHVTGAGRDILERLQQQEARLIEIVQARRKADKMELGAAALRGALLKVMQERNNTKADHLTRCNRMGHAAGQALKSESAGADLLEQHDKTLRELRTVIHDAWSALGMSLAEVAQSEPTLTLAEATVRTMKSERDALAESKSKIAELEQRLTERDERIAAFELVLKDGKVTKG